MVYSSDGEINSTKINALIVFNVLIVQWVLIVIIQKIFLIFVIGIAFTHHLFGIGNALNNVQLVHSKNKYMELICLNGNLKHNFF